VLRLAGLLARHARLLARLLILALALLLLALLLFTLLLLALLLRRVLVVLLVHDRAPLHVRSGGRGGYHCKGNDLPRKAVARFVRQIVA